MMKGIGIAITVAVVAVGLFAFKGGSSEVKSFDLTYEVSCKSCNVTYISESGERVDETNISGTWTKSFKGQDGQFVFVSASNEAGGTTVNLKQGSEVMQTGSSSQLFKSSSAGIIL